MNPEEKMARNSEVSKPELSDSKIENSEQKNITSSEDLKLAQQAKQERLSQIGLGRQKDAEDLQKVREMLGTSPEGQDTNNAEEERKDKNLLDEYSRTGGIRDTMDSYRNNPKVDRVDAENNLATQANFFYNLSKRPNVLREVLNDVNSKDAKNIARAVENLKVPDPENYGQRIALRDMKKFLKE